MSLLRRLLLSLTLALLLVTAQPSYARGKLQGWVNRGGQKVTINNGLQSTNWFMRSYPGASVTVKLSGTSTNATIYSDAAGTAKSNPFSADSSGFWFFYAEDGCYDISFSGTTAYTLSDMCIASGVPHYSIKSFGAKCDGTTDDTTAIQAAITAARDVAVVEFPAAICIATTLRLYTGSSLRGAGEGVSIIKRSAAGSGGAFIAMTSGQIAQKIQIANLRVDGNSIGSGLNGIELGTETPGATDYAFGSSIQDVTVINATGVGMRLHVNVAEVRNAVLLANNVGLHVTGTAFYGFNLSLVNNTAEAAIIAAAASAIFGLETEVASANAAKDVIEVSQRYVSLYSVWSNCAVARRSVVGTTAAGTDLIVTNLHLEGTGPTDLINDSAVSAQTIAKLSPGTNAIPYFSNSTNKAYTGPIMAAKPYMTSYPASNTLFNGTEAGTGEYRGTGNFWAIRTDAANGFNVDVYNGGAPKNAVQINQNGSIELNGGVVVLAPTAFASLGADPNGTITYCSDCGHGTSPCAGAGSGAVAKRLSGVWQCN